MTKIEIQTLQNVIRRLEKPNCGCSNDFLLKALVEQCNANGIEAASRLYLNTWVIPALKMLLPGEHYNPELARSFSS